MTMPAAQAESSGRALLRQLLSERNQFPERVDEIDDKIRAVFERRVAVLVLDMVGFSRLSQKHGIIFYLSMIAQMDSAARPAVEGNGGRVIKQEADNLFAIFEDSTDALEASLDIFRGFEAINGVVPDDRDIFGSVGIGYGPTLVVGEEDLFGCEVNLASKLGEDIAGASEILLTRSAFENLTPNRYRCDPASHPISGMRLEYHHFRAKMTSDGRDIVSPRSPGRSPE